MFIERAMIGALAAAVAFSPAWSETPAPSESQSLIGAVKSGKLLLDARYRFEWKDQQGFAENARAHTFRTRLGFETGQFHNFKALIEFENVVSLNERFNSTTNGAVQYPVVADPDATELNRLQLSYTGIPKTEIVVGRQAYNLLNQRFVGAVDFRQNQQTFDAVRLSTAALGKVSLDYAYIGRVHRVFGDDHPLGEFDSDSHVISARYDGGALGKLAGYALLLNFENAQALSSRTFGLRYENAFALDKQRGVSFGLTGDFATQSDSGANPFDYRASYVHAEAAFTVKPITLRAGYERLGGNGVIGFSTPLATLHKFQGNADVFLTTPVDGVADVYGSAAVKWKQAPFDAAVELFATYHKFSSGRGDQDFGREIDAGLAAAIGPRWSAEIKGAVYDGASAFADRALVWASIRYRR